MRHVNDFLFLFYLSFSSLTHEKSQLQYLVANLYVNTKSKNFRCFEETLFFEEKILMS